MVDYLAFFLAAAALLMTPGPTNSLLLTAAAEAGAARSLKLILAEVLGYALSVCTLGLVLGPIVQEHAGVSVLLRSVSCAYLLYVAWRLWRRSSDNMERGRPVNFHTLLLATLANPKGLVFAFVIIPHMGPSDIRGSLIHVGWLLLLVALSGGFWIGVGAFLGSSLALSVSVARRVGALVVACFAAVLGSSIVGL